MTFNLPTPPENILTSGIPGGVEVSTCRYATGRYETRAFLPDGGVIDAKDDAVDFTLSDALRTHAEVIDILCGTDPVVRRNVVKVDISDR